jgi:hypothetical protein
MKATGRWVSIAVVLMSVLFTSHLSFAAYNHLGDIDSANFRSAYPDKVGTKLDSCTTCHSGGSYTSGSPPRTTVLGSCQWCHYITDYGNEATPETLIQTLNPYGIAYKTAGRSVAALGTISSFDSDGDTFVNGAEIVALTYPGDRADDPTKVPAPSRVISLMELEEMPSHKQFMLMNASKSDDSYTLYSGVAMENLVKAVMLDSATGITVYSPDGFATYHPFTPISNPNSYHVFGIYPEGTFWYNERADIAIYPPDPDLNPAPPDTNYATGGWCNYSSPSAAGLQNGTPIFNPEGLKMLLAFERDGEYLTPGELNQDNKLDGEGPFRVVPPQKNPGWPDQRSSSVNQNVIWPYNRNADHNAGFSSRTVTMIKVEPLPAGTTDINTLEAGWPYVDERKVVIYGSIDPYLLDKLNTKLDSLIDSITDAPASVFKVKSSKTALVNKIEAIKKQVANGAYSAALTKLKQDFLKKTNGYLSGAVDANDWVKDLDAQKELVSQIQIIWVMLVLIGA